MVFRLLVPYHLAGVVCYQEVGTVNEAALVEDHFDLMMALAQEEAIGIQSNNRHLLNQIGTQRFSSL